jgi:hypothetical protein
MVVYTCTSTQEAKAGENRKFKASLGCIAKPCLKKKGKKPKMIQKQKHWNIPAFRNQAGGAPVTEVRIRVFIIFRPPTE